MKMYYKLLLRLVLVIGVLVSGCSQERLNCTDSGGQRKVFENSGADICGQIGRGADVMTTSCDCGPDKCWNGESCELN